MRDLVTVGHGPHRCPGQHGADRSALMEDHTHQPGEELGRARPAHQQAPGPPGERMCTARPRPKPDESSQSPQVNEQDQAVLFAADGRDEKVLDDIQLPGDHASQRDPDEQ